MPIGSGIVYNTGDLILSQVSSSGTAFLETKIAAATSSLIYFDSTARINSASLNSITVGTASYVSGSTSIITNLTASNISASGTSSFGMVGIGTSNVDAKLTILGTSAQGTAYNAINLNNSDRGGASIGFKNFTDASVITLASVNVISEDAGSGNYNDGVFTINTAEDTTNLERFRITSRGNVGIGTTAPGARFEISSSTAASLLNVKGAGGNAILFVSGSGNVGIGTSSPASKLHISGSGQTIMRLDSDTTTNVSQFQIKAASDAVLIMGMQGGSAASTNFGVTAAGQAYFGTTTLGSSHPTSLVIATASPIPTIFSTNNVERMRIDSGGAVGIGTTTVSRTLHTYVTTGPVMRLQSSGSNASIEFIPSIGHNRYNWLIGAQQNISDAFEITPSTATNGTTFSTPAVLVKSDGNVGIGTTSPATRLHVYSAGGGFEFGVGSSNCYIETIDRASVSKDLNTGYYTRGTGSFTWNNGAYTERMRIDGSGSVLIGVNGAYNSSRLLQVKDGLLIGNSFYTFASIDTNGTADLILSSNANPANLGSNSNIIFKLGTSVGGGPEERMRIVSNGNVGIGTTSPTGSLHVNKSSQTLGATTPSGATIISNLAGGNGILELGVDTTNLAYIQSRNIIDQTYYKLLLNPSGGNIGIGTTSPLSLLDVRSGYITAGSSASTNGSTILAGYYSDSAGILTVLGTEYSSGGPVLGYAVTPSTSSTAAFFSSTTIAIPRSAYVQDGGTHRWYTGQSQTVAIGSAVSTSERMRINSDGNLGIGTTNPVARLQVAGNISGSSFTSSISNAVGFLGTSSWAQNVVSASFATTAQTANALNPANSYTITNLTASNISASGTISASKLRVVGTANVIELVQATAGSATYYVMDNTVETGGRRYRFGYSGASADKGSFTIYNATDNITPFTILTDGNVGIGTLTPTTKLHVSGSITSTDGRFISNVTSGTDKYFLDCYGTSTNQIFALYENNNTAYLNSYSSMAFRANQNGGSGGYFIFSGANVGIGTTIPNSVLNVHDINPFVRINNTSTSDQGIKISYNNSDTHGLHLIYNPNYAVSYIDNTYPTSSGQVFGDIYFRQNVAGTMTTRMTIKADGGGNVGIGTTSPVQKLHIVGSTLIANGNYHYGYTLVGAQATLIGISASDNISVGQDNVNHANTYIYGGLGIIDLSTSGSTRMRVGYNGYVGIGTTNPAVNLEVVGASETVGTIRINGGKVNVLAVGEINSALEFAQRDASIAGLVSGKIASISEFSNGAYAGLGFYTAQQSRVPELKEAVRITNNGDVGIGTSNPAFLLDVSGSSRHGYRAADTHQFTGSVSVSGSLNATASWANNVVSASYALTSSFATRAQTANALNSSNTYSIAGLTSAYVDVDGAGTIPTTGIYRPSTKTLGLSADGTLIFKISNVSSPATSSIETGNFIVQTGNVGLGTNSPNNKLDIFGATGTTLNMSNVDDGNRGGKLTFISSSATGRQFYVGTNSSIYNLVFGIDSIERARIDTSGNLGIGITSPTVRLHVSGSSIITNPNPSANSAVLLVQDEGAVTTVKDGTTLRVVNNGSAANFSVFEASSAVSDFVILNNGNVGIGATSPNAKLDVRGYIVSDVNGNAVESGFYLGSSAHGLRRPVGSNDIYLHTTTGNLYLGTTGNTSQQVTLLSNGNVGIGTVTPAAKLEITGSSNSALLNIKSPISGAILYVSGSGAVGIGTSNVGAFTLQVSGSFGATTKSFIIDHPTKAGKKLMYGSLESPYHGIRLTGRDTLVNGKCKVELPDYIYKLILHDSVNIQLTGIKCNKTLYVDDINIPENYFTIAYDKAIFESYKDYDFFWDFTAIRADVPELITEM